MLKSERLENNSIPEPNSGCWLWLGAIFKKTGYGLFQWGVGKKMSAHRASFLVYRGQIPAGMMVLHKCDNRICINPDHLWLGTGEENMRDMVEKRRSSFGERNYGAKLTEDQVREIKKFPSDFRSVDIAKVYGVSRGTIGNIRNGKNWVHVN